jgi:exosortase
VQQFMLPVSLWCDVFALAGWPIARVLLLPIALQYFGMPVWDLLINLLQAATVTTVQVVLRLMQIPAWFQRNHIHLPDGILTVADSCSGLNLLLAILLIATLQSEMGRYDTRRRFALFAIAAMIGILDNWIRVVALILIGYYSKMQNPLIYDHASFGWWIYAASLIPFFWFAHLLERCAPQSAAPISQKISHSINPSLAHIATLIVIIVGGELAVRTLNDRVGRVEQLVVSGSARAITPEFIPHYSGYDARQAWELLSANGRYELLALIYTQQKDNKKLIYYDNVIADDLRIKETGDFQVASGRLKYALISDAQPRIVWWYYWIDDAVTTSALRAKLYQAKAALIGDPSAALIVLSQRCVNNDCDLALKRAQSTSDDSVFAQMLSIKAILRAGK